MHHCHKAVVHVYSEENRIIVLLWTTQNNPDFNPIESLCQNLNKTYNGEFKTKKIGPNYSIY